MCGRFIATSPGAALARLYALIEEPDEAPRYNVAPGQGILIIRRSVARGRNQSTKAVWGFRVDHSAGSAAVSTAKVIINARAETAAERPLFRNELRTSRVIIPADGWYEWKRDGSDATPHLATPKDGRPLSLAGLWRRSDDPEHGGDVVILTTAPSPELAWLHDRMPATIPPENVEAWLEPRVVHPRAALSLIARPEEISANTTEVSKRVNRVMNDDSGCMEPIRTRKS